MSQYNTRPVPILAENGRELWLVVSDKDGTLVPLVGPCPLPPGWSEVIQAYKERTQ